MFLTEPPTRWVQIRRGCDCRNTCTFAARRARQLRPAGRRSIEGVLWSDLQLPLGVRAATTTVPVRSGRGQGGWAGRRSGAAPARASTERGLGRPAFRRRQPALRSSLTLGRSSLRWSITVPQQAVCNRPLDGSKVAHDDTAHGTRTTLY